MNKYGLLGEKLGHSISPKIHKILFDYFKWNYKYNLYEIENDKLDSFINKIKDEDIKGFNITIPYKEDIMEYLDEVSDEVEKIGAVNTVLNDNGRLLGYNTDYFGFGYLLEENNVDAKDKIAVILGYGGAAKALEHYLLDKGVTKLYVASRNPNKELNRDRLEFISYDELKDIKGDIIVNSTPVGMYPNIDNSPIDENIIDNYNILVDIIYNPEETLFMKIGKEKNKIVIGGLLMLIGQAVKAEEIWQKSKIEKDVSKKIYMEIEKDFK